MLRFSSGPSIQSQNIELHRSNIWQQGTVSPSTQNLVLLSLLDSYNSDQQLLMLQQELQYQSFVNQLQIHHGFLSPDSARWNLLTIRPHHPSSLLLEQQQVQSRSLESLLAVPNQHLRASMVLPQLPVQGTLTNNFTGPPMDSELLRIVVGAQSPVTSVTTDPRPSTSALLAQPGDAAILSAYQVFLRRNIEVFQASSVETSTHVRGRNTAVYIHQVGIRCIHCKHIPLARRQKGSMYFPSITLRIYQAAQNMATAHMISGLCSEMPDHVKEQFHYLMATKSTGGSGGREYWAKCARDLGLVDTPNGIRSDRTNRLTAA
jgi:hypothetical protein